MLTLSKNKQNISGLAKSEYTVESEIFFVSSRRRPETRDGRVGKYCQDVEC